jgi:hypothetical protein
MRYTQICVTCPLRTRILSYLLQEHFYKKRFNACDFDIQISEFLHVNSLCYLLDIANHAVRIARLVEA